MDKGIIVGTARIDIIAKTDEKKGKIRDGKINSYLGGPALNVLLNLRAQGKDDLRFVSALPKDSLLAQTIISSLLEKDLSIDDIELKNNIPEPSYTAHYHKNKLISAISSASVEMTELKINHIDDFNYIFADLTNSQKTLNSLIKKANKKDKPIFLVGTSEMKILKFLELDLKNSKFMITMNQEETKALLTEAGYRNFLDFSKKYPNGFFVLNRGEKGLAVVKNGKVISGVIVPKAEFELYSSGTEELITSILIKTLENEFFDLSEEEQKKSLNSSLELIEPYLKFLLEREAPNLIAEPILIRRDIYHDPTTGLKNDRYIDELNFLKAVQAETEVPIAVCIVRSKDADNSFNKGEITRAEKMMSIIANVLKEEFKEPTLVLRNGQNQFVVIGIGQDADELKNQVFHTLSKASANMAMAFSNVSLKFELQSEDLEKKDLRQRIEEINNYIEENKKLSSIEFKSRMKKSKAKSL